jgi:hypothetical protein
VNKLTQFIKSWWAEILVFAIVIGSLLTDLNPNFTFMNKAADSMGYIYSAKYLYPSYHTSPPLYLLSGHFAMMLPFGTDAWKMGLLSVIGTIVACVFIYLTIMWMLREKKGKRLFSLLGVLLYGLSALVLSQSVIVNTYTLVCACAIGAYYFGLKQQWKRMGLMMGIGLAIHVLMGFVFITMLVFVKGYRKNWKAIAITLSFGLFYIYIPLTNRPPQMWLPSAKDVNSIVAFVTDTLKTAGMLMGELSVWALPKRIFDTIGLIGVSIGIVTIVPIVYYFWQLKSVGQSIWKNLLFWLIITPLTIFLADLDMNTFDYTIVAMPFLIIIACCGMWILWDKYGDTIKGTGVVAIVFIVAMVLGIYNVNYFDIGRTLDKNLSATNLYKNEFPKIPDGAIFMPNFAWEWEAMFLYNRDTGKHIIPVCIDMLPSELYQTDLGNEGVQLISNNDYKDVNQAAYMAQSIVKLNKNVWTTVSTNPGTFGTKVEETNGDTSLIITVDEKLAENMATHPTVLWKPYNPYDIMSTSITVTEWKNVLLSNYNVLTMVMLGTIGAVPLWILWQLIIKKKKWKMNKVKVEDGINGTESEAKAETESEVK